MYDSDQTLRHKRKKILVRMCNEEGQYSCGLTNTFIDEYGNKFHDDINNYTCVIDELGFPYSNIPKKGQFVDESAKKYLVSKKTLMKMREEKLLLLEKEILFRMTSTRNNNFRDVKRKQVMWPFHIDGGNYFNSIFYKFFMKRRKAKPLYKKYNDIYEKFVDGPLVFSYNKQTWIYEFIHDRLIVIKL